MSGLRVAVLGCGYWGSKHARVLHALNDVEQVVLVDSREERLHSVARSVAGASSFLRLQDALPEVDAVVVATPPTTHAALALQIMEAGRHVLVEKPLATTSDDAQALVEASQAAGVVLMVGHTFEYHAAVWKLRELIDDAELGALYYIDTARLNLGLYQPDVNVVMDLAPHDISILNYLLGQEPSSVQAWGSRHAHRRFEDVAYLRLHYDDLGLSANIHVSWLDPCKVRRVTAVGSQKMAVYNDLATEDRLRIHDKGVTEPVATPDQTAAPMSYRYGDIRSPFFAVDEPLAVQDRHFLRCVREGLEPRTGGRNGLSVVRVLECAQRSLAQRRPVALEEVGDRIIRVERDAVVLPIRMPVPREADSLAASGGRER